MRGAWLITEKEIRLQLRNRSVLVLGFIAPLSLAFVLNVVFGGLGDPEESITFDVGLVAVGQDTPTGSFVDTVDDIAATGVLDLTTYDDEQSARDAVSDGDVGAAWLLPEGFSAAVDEGGETQLTVIGGIDAPTTTSVARSIAERFATGVGTSTLAGLVAAETGVISDAEITTVAEDIAAEPPLARTTRDEAESSMLGVTTSLTAGLALFFLFFTAGMPLISVLEERETGTLSRLLVAPIRAGSVRAGKTIAAVLLGVVSLVSLMAASAVLMDADWGPPVGALLVATAAVIAVSGIMIVPGAVARTTEQAGNVQAITAIVLAFLGGAFMPLPSQSGLLEDLRMATPHGWFIEGLQDLHTDGLVGALPAITVLVAMGVAGAALGLPLSRSMMRR